MFVGRLLIIALYVVSALAHYQLCKRAGVKHRWMVWVPILYIFPILWTIQKSGWNVLFLLIPVANIVFAIIWHVKYLHAFGRSGHWLWFILLPVLGPIIMVIVLAQTAYSRKTIYHLRQPGVTPDFDSFKW
ncbi:DUF5684 domain-containing protein [Alicyclobacillus fastidiosus]|uniref:DUF5684 domain-containing protein n=1 Tax=Alicyclobacillus fastidiosus TaxID=392011 RepID=A0ABY6ZCH2_9BACL|nr:DUF5684 domain-containing protein [Alicyclobacillus fastidiosus]WAH40222.1 DUF5684 domain-containing protein [Alicyclobacillus fastidiosus]GMA61583.1 hypothetical protein GCM10025859_20230 [Alicyclobacillus fastidiosus]